MLKRIFLFLFPLSFVFCSEEGSLESAIKALLEHFNGNENEDFFTQTSHTIELPDGPISYTALTGTLPQYTDSGEVAGTIFFTAYLKENEEPEARPLTFIFNGGPGGSSLSMHIGGLGPRRLLLPEEGQKTLPPYQLIDNAETMLDVTDLIMIDPMGTGYSEPKSEYKNSFHSVEGDLWSFAEFIRVFCIETNRWNSPKYLMGASYGTLRCCGLAEELMNHGIHLNGIILMSPVLDLNTLAGGRDSPLADCLRLPTFAATSWYHGKTMQNQLLSEVMDYARRFAFEQYAPVMMQPMRLSPREQKAFYQKLSDLIGLPVETIQRYQARINEQIYVTEFFAKDRKVIGGIDSRYIGPVSAIAGEYIEDPSYRNLRPAFYPAFLNYLQNDLETSISFPKYNSFSSQAFWRWDWSTFDGNGSWPNFMQRLRRTLVGSPDMKVFVGCGCYDIRTPFAAAEYSLEHLELPENYRNNFQIEYYKAGHGYIFDLPSLKKFRKDLFCFYGN